MFACYNSKYNKMKHNSVRDAFRGNHRTTARAPVGRCGDEESTVQIRHNSHCRYVAAGPPVGMLIVLCRNAFPGKGGGPRRKAAQGGLFAHPPQGSFPWGVLCFRFL